MVAVSSDGGIEARCHSSHGCVHHSVCQSGGIGLCIYMLLSLVLDICYRGPTSNCPPCQPAAVLRSGLQVKTLKAKLFINISNQFRSRLIKVYNGASPPRQFAIVKRSYLFTSGVHGSIMSLWCTGDDWDSVHLLNGGSFTCFSCIWVMALLTSLKWEASCWVTHHCLVVKP